MREPDQGVNGPYQGFRAPPPAIPVGTIIMYAGGALATTNPRTATDLTPPAGWVRCDGRVLRRSDYTELYAVIGITYGNGGSTNGHLFNAPDFGRDISAATYRIPIGAGQGAGLTNRALGATGGADTVVLSSSEVPIHTHGIVNATNLFRSTGATIAHSTGTSTTTSLAILATGSSPGGIHHDTHQPSVSLYFLIRAFDPSHRTRQI